MKRHRGTTLIELLMVVAGLATILGLAGLGLSTAMNNNRKTLTEVCVTDMARSVNQDLSRSVKLTNRKAGMQGKGLTAVQSRQEALNAVAALLQKMDSTIAMQPVTGSIVEWQLYPSYKEDAWGNNVYYAISFYDNPKTGVTADTSLTVMSGASKDKELRVWVLSYGSNGTGAISINPALAGLAEEDSDDIFSLTQSVNGKVETEEINSEALNVYSAHADATHAGKCRCPAFAYIGL